MELEKGVVYKVQLKKYHHFYSVPTVGKSVCEIMVKTCKSTKGANKTVGKVCEIEWVKVPAMFRKSDFPFTVNRISKNNRFDFWFLGDADYELVFLT